MTVAVGVVSDAEGAEASLADALAAALEANRQLAEMVGELRAENARLRVEIAEQAAELENLRADLAVLQRLLFGRSSERSRPEPPGGGGAGDTANDGGQDRGNGSGAGSKRGPGARAGRRDYAHLPRLRFPGISRVVGIAARSVGSRSRRWEIMCPASSWTGR